MKKIIVLIALVITGSAFAQPFKSKAYKTGIYVFCGKEVPRQFTYLIERKSPTANSWTAVAQLHAPKNEAECMATLLNMPLALAQTTVVTDDRVHKFWLRAQSTLVLDSLFSLAFVPCYQSALGCAWFDDGLTQNADYQYRINKVSKSGEKTPIDSISVIFPSNPYQATLRASRFKLNEGYVSISYEVGDSLNTAGVKVFRSRYKEKKFSEIVPEVYFTREDGKIVAIVNDYDALKDVTYSYLAIPYDVLGNMGKATKDTLNVYNFTKAADLGITEFFDVTAMPEKKGNALKWKLKTNQNVASIEIYRSPSYNGRYLKIGSVSGTSTEYFDSYNLQPAMAYYYYIQINNGYGNSLPSARVPAILKGTKLNFLPPQNFELSRNGRFVTLTFHRLDRDTRGYYVYRANGYVAPLEQLPRMLMSRDSMLTYCDTLPLKANAEVYSYAVASVNSSYNISPITQRLSTSYSGGMLPVPSKVTALRFGKAVFVTWDNVSDDNAAISAYRVYRSQVDADDKEIGSPLMLATTRFSENSYTDSTITDGMHYRYRVQCIGSDSSDVSSISMAAGINIPEQLPLQPGSILVFAGDATISLHWDLPSDKSVIAIHIYRATSSYEAKLLKELAATATQFEDATAEPGQTYYYFVRTVNRNGKESKPTDGVSGKIK